MKKIIYTILVLACVAITACTSEDSLNPPEQIAAQNANKVSVQEALSRADGYFNAFNKQTGTRSSGSARKVKSVEAVRSKVATRSSGNNMLDTLYYIINYADDSGFAVMSADKRTIPLYAISEDGRFDINDTVFNKGLALFVNGMENDIMTYRPDFPGVPTDTTNNSDTELGIKIYEYAGPYFTETVSVWHQIAPQNKFCPEIDGEKCLVGCPAIGTAQVMSFYKHPSEYNGHVYDWDDILSNFNSESTAHLLADLGNPENFNMRYGTITSGSYPWFLDRTLYNMGYQHVGTSGGEFQISEVIEAIKGGPLIAAGSGQDGDGMPTGHFWSIDGYRIYWDDFSIIENKSIPVFHCVWGWGGHDNGYFYWGNQFDLNLPKDLDYPNDKVENHSIFSTNVQYWGNIRRRVTY